MPQTGEPFVLALDFGSSSVRAALFDRKGQRISRTNASQRYRIEHPTDHAAELNPTLLLRATRSCLRKTGGLTNRKVRAIGASSFWHSLLGLDRAGRPLTPIYMWADARAASDAAQLRKKLQEQEILERTGCMLRASFWPAKLQWIRRREPKVFRTVMRWVSPADWVFEQLFGIRSCSQSMASGTGLYNLAKREWDPELAGLSGLTSEQLNPLLAEIDWRDGKIFTALGDGAAGNLGSGALQPREVAINVGTSAAVRTVVTKKTTIPFGFFRFVVDDKRLLVGGAVSNAGNLRAWCLRELRLAKKHRSIEKMLRETAIPDRLTILPFLVPERAPTWPQNLDGLIAGLTSTTSAADLLRASVTSVFLRLSSILEVLEGSFGNAKRIIVSGGILRSPASLQLLANALGRDVEVCVEQEASLRGAAVHALTKMGETPRPLREGRIVRHDRRTTTRMRRQKRRQEVLERILLSAASELA